MAAADGAALGALPDDRGRLALGGHAADVLVARAALWPERRRWRPYNQSRVEKLRRGRAGRRPVAPVAEVLLLAARARPREEETCFRAVEVITDILVEQGAALLDGGPHTKLSE